MMTLSLIGYLGADAEIKEENGSRYLQFRVSSNRNYTDAAGNKIEHTDWVSCFLRGSFERVAPFLRRGQRVFVSGQPSFRAYSSEKARAWVAGVSLSVRDLELIGQPKTENPQPEEPQDEAQVF